MSVPLPLALRTVRAIGAVLPVALSVASGAVLPRPMRFVRPETEAVASSAARKLAIFLWEFIVSFIERGVLPQPSKNRGDRTTTRQSREVLVLVLPAGTYPSEHLGITATECAIGA